MGIGKTWGRETPIQEGFKVEVFVNGTLMYDAEVKVEGEACSLELLTGYEQDGLALVYLFKDIERRIRKKGLKRFYTRIEPDADQRLRRIYDKLGMTELATIYGRDL